MLVAFRAAAPDTTGRGARTGVRAKSDMACWSSQETAMTAFRRIPIPTETAERFRRSGVYDNGDTLRRMVATDGNSFPCRHCLRFAKPGEMMLFDS